MNVSFRVYALVFAFLSAVACRPPVIEDAPTVPPGGRAVAIAVMPGSDPVMLVASETGGLFRTEDGGQTWTHVDALPSWRVRDVEFSPSNGNIVLATTEDDFLTEPNGGIWRSTDGGRTWSRPAGAVPPASPRCTDRPSAWGISFHRNSTIIAVGTDCGVAIGSGQGASWTHVVPNPTVPVGPRRRQNRVHSVLSLPGARLYVAGVDGIHRSADGGGTWVRSTGAPTGGQDGVVHGLAASPFNVDHVFLVARTPDENNVLFLSTDAAGTWTRISSGDANPPRAGFVRIARTAPPPGTSFEVYFGGGVRVRRASFVDGAPPTAATAFQVVTVDHADPSDVAFSLNGITPILVATDGGVHRSRDGGATFSLTGSGPNGYNALQITEVTGQLVSTEPHTDLYFATQDNMIWGSPDGGVTWPGSICCEGFHVRVARRANGHGAGIVTGGRCGPPCRSWLADAHLANSRQWPNAPDGDAINTEADDQGIPFLIRAGIYVQRVANNDVDPPEHHLMLTTNTGASWADRGVIPASLVGPWLVSGGETADPVVYSAVRRDGVNADGSPRLGLVRIENVFPPAALQVVEAGDGLESLGTFPTMFAWYRVFGVDPSDPNRLLAPDLGAGVMKSSRDGGQTWTVETELTDLVTSGGQQRFSYSDGFTLVTAVAWDPDNSCHVLVGTAQNGIVRSADGGDTWERIDGSRRITNLSRFFVETPNRVRVSTYGRGLWRLSVPRALEQCGPVRPRPPQSARVLEIWEMTHARPYPFEAPGRPPVCPECTYVLLHWGEVIQVDLAGSTLTGLGVSGGLVRHVNQRGEPLPVPAVRMSLGRATAKDGDLFEEIRRRGIPVRGLVLAGTEVRAYLAGAARLDTTGLHAPRLRIAPEDPTSGDVLISPGDRILVRGSGLDPSAGLIMLSFDGRPVKTDLRSDRLGRFRWEIVVKEMPGDHAVEVRQTGRLATRIARAMFKVVPRDEFKDSPGQGN